jgi:hypothetical protein
MEVSGQLPAPAALVTGKVPPVPIGWVDGRVGGAQSCSGRGGEEKNTHPLPGIEPYNPDRPACSSVAVPTELSRLLLYVCYNQRIYRQSK